MKSESLLTDLKPSHNYKNIKFHRTGSGTLSALDCGLTCLPVNPLPDMLLHSRLWAVWGRRLCIITYIPDSNPVLATEDLHKSG